MAVKFQNILNSLKTKFNDAKYQDKDFKYIINDICSSSISKEDNNVNNSSILNNDNKDDNSLSVQTCINNAQETQNNFNNTNI